MNKIVLATNNQHKVDELKPALAKISLNLISAKEFNLNFPNETGLTFVENALLKARFVAKETNLPALADDSGLCVEALNNDPGIYSARYAGENTTDAQNRLKLLNVMQNEQNRTASFVCCLVLVKNHLDPLPLIALGFCSGVITEFERGENGFGYDPIFNYLPLNKTFAEISAEQKQKISHRSKALEKLQQLIANDNYWKNCT